MPEYSSKCLLLQGKCVQRVLWHSSNLLVAERRCTRIGFGHEQALHALIKVVHVGLTIGYFAVDKYM